MHIFKDTTFDFLRWRWHAVALSVVMILAGSAMIATRGLPIGIEFGGGTAIIAQFEDQPSIEAVRTALTEAFPGGGQNIVVQGYGDPSLRQVMVRVPEVGDESGASLSTIADETSEALRQGNLGEFTVVGTEIVGPAVGQELATKGLYAFAASLVGILAYIAFRFQLSFAVGAVVATIHDILITVAFLSFFQYDLTLNVVAAILTVTGYSTNDTIVIFDRVRENLRSRRREPLRDVVNRSINQTLGRTVITMGTTLFSAVALFMFGGEVLRGFAFTMIVGVITGTYSSVFVAAAVVTLWRDRNATARGAAQSAQVASSRPAPPKRAKSNRRASAS